MLSFRSYHAHRPRSSCTQGKRALRQGGAFSRLSHTGSTPILGSARSIQWEAENSDAHSWNVWHPRRRQARHIHCRPSTCCGLFVLVSWSEGHQLQPAAAFLGARQQEPLHSLRPTALVAPLHLDRRDLQTAHRPMLALPSPPERRLKYVFVVDDEPRFLRVFVL